MGLKKSFIEEVYEAMSKEELIAVATNDINDLTPEALDALTCELNRRNITSEVKDAIKIQQKKFNPKEFLFYINLIRTQPCPNCFETDFLLNGVIITKIKNNIIFSSKQKEFLIACPDCLKKAIDKSGGFAFSLNALGLIKGAVESLMLKHEMQLSLEKLKEEMPSDSLIYFIQKKIGEIELHKDNHTKLSDLIRNANASFF